MGRPYSSSMMRVSIIIPSLNSPIIEQVVGRIVGQERIDQVDEIIIVGKDAAGLIPAHRLVRFVDTGVAIPAGAARNIGIEQSTSELLIFLDSDCLPAQGWLKNHILAHEIGHDVVGGGVRPSGDSYWHLVYNLTLFHESFSTSQPRKQPYLPTLNLSVKRDLLNDVEPINTQLQRGEDVDWTARLIQAGNSLWFEPSATIIHDHNRRSFRAVWDDCADSGFYMRQVRLQHADHLKTPFILRYRLLLIILAPLIATVRTFGIVRQHRTEFRKHFTTVPAIWMTKMAWCWGAARQVAT